MLHHFKPSTALSSAMIHTKVARIRHPSHEIKHNHWQIGTASRHIQGFSERVIHDHQTALLSTRNTVQKKKAQGNWQPLDLVLPNGSSAGSAGTVIPQMGFGEEFSLGQAISALPPLDSTPIFPMSSPETEKKETSKWKKPEPDARRFSRVEEIKPSRPAEYEQFSPEISSFTAPAQVERVQRKPAAEPPPAGEEFTPEPKTPVIRPSTTFVEIKGPAARRQPEKPPEEEQPGQPQQFSAPPIRVISPIPSEKSQARPVEPAHPSEVKPALPAVEPVRMAPPAASIQRKMSALPSRQQTVPAPPAKKVPPSQWVIQPAASHKVDGTVVEPAPDLPPIVRKPSTIAPVFPHKTEGEPPAGPILHEESKPVETLPTPVSEPSAPILPTVQTGKSEPAALPILKPEPGPLAPSTQPETPAEPPVKDATPLKKQPIGQATPILTIQKESVLPARPVLPIRKLNLTALAPIQRTSASIRPLPVIQSIQAGRHIRKDIPASSPSYEIGNQPEDITPAGHEPLAPVPVLLAAPIPASTSIPRPQLGISFRMEPSPRPKNQPFHPIEKRLPVPSLASSHAEVIQRSPRPSRMAVTPAMAISGRTHRSGTSSPTVHPSEGSDQPASSPVLQRGAPTTHWLPLIPPRPIGTTDWFVTRSTLVRTFQTGKTLNKGSKKTALPSPTPSVPSRRVRREPIQPLPADTVQLSAIPSAEAIIQRSQADVSPSRNTQPQNLPLPASHPGASPVVGKSARNPVEPRSTEKLPTPSALPVVTARPNRPSAAEQIVEPIQLSSVNPSPESDDLAGGDLPSAKVEPKKPSVSELAEKVYPLIRRMLEIEYEHKTGRPY